MSNYRVYRDTSSMPTLYYVQRRVTSFWERLKLSCGEWYFDPEVSPNFLTPEDALKHKKLLEQQQLLESGEVKEADIKKTFQGRSTTACDDQYAPDPNAKGE